MSLPAQREVLLQCFRSGSFEAVAGAWESLFVKEGCVLRHGTSGQLILAIGHVQYAAHVA
eukprot:3889306-Lingulodinium_polyedra.AAC.1